DAGAGAAHTVSQPTSSGAALPPGIGVPDASTPIAGSGLSPTAASARGQVGVSTAFVPLSSGGGGMPEGTAGTEPAGADASPGAWLIPPDHNGLRIPVQRASAAPRAAEAAPESDMGLPVDDGTEFAEPVLTAAGPVSAAGGDPTSRAGWLWHGVGLAVLAGATTAWLLHRPRHRTDVS